MPRRALPGRTAPCRAWPHLVRILPALSNRQVPALPSPTSPRRATPCLVLPSRVLTLSPIGSPIKKFRKIFSLESILLVPYTLFYAKEIRSKITSEHSGSLSGIRCCGNKTNGQSEPADGYRDGEVADTQRIGNGENRAGTGTANLRREKGVTLQLINGRLDLTLERETPGISWRDGTLCYSERYSFPVRCGEKVWSLFAECEKLPPGQRAAHVRSRRREILWS